MDKLKETNNMSIIASDFNSALNPDIDCFDYVNCNQHPKARNKVLKIIIECDMIDCWRDQNLEKRQYTWFKKNTNQKARLDFNLYPNHYRLTKMQSKCILVIGLTTLYCFKKNVSLIKNTITQTKEQYAVDDKLLTGNGEEINNQDLKLTIDDQLFFETLLCEIRGKNYLIQVIH